MVGNIYEDIEKAFDKDKHQSDGDEDEYEH